MPTHPHLFDVAIIGGGIIGSATAYYLMQQDPQLSVCVIEPDPGYELASALRSSGGCRVQFTGAENIAMSLYSIDFIKNFEHTMATATHPAPVDWVEGGYLFVVPPQDTANLERNARFQQSQGCTLDLLSPAELKDRFPAMYVDDLGAGVHTPHDGWCDPYGLLWGFRRKAIELGVQYIAERVVAADHDAVQAKSVTLGNGQIIRATSFVNATGAWSGDVAKLFNMSLPIVPVRRFEHYFTPGSHVGHLPYVKDTARLAFRSEGQGYSGGLVDGNVPRGYHFEVDHKNFEEVVWPAVAHRFPAFEAARCHRSWAGLYEVNELDGNPVIGAWNARLPNLYTVAGFSGHGMMHAPAAGRGIAELIIHGRFQSIDLSRLGYERVEQNAPYPEQGIL
ncbi:NAD(P)/FAD-dependent oxidoreductase [Advenella mimigardefordensis]|uniref:Putative FAD-dependent oxidoreductase n=1 Tax=Advenella mimigardefordensis (strain DSM 17166 / LMG 22922 / DPN7) TaxID=1247726 RepID=W0PE25_ADVMD|nr:FAD-dependent oxidoreductase [Advenella mimigardefordensis]AHG65134.1 putative FAD-dependent oxidoreductase [Advenella mimigardefordensis DPN7]